MMKYTRKTLPLFKLSWYLWICLPALCCVAQDEKAADEKPQFDRAVYLDSFDQVWKTVKETHWDPTLVAENWDRARDEFRPKMEQASSTREAIEILQELLATLEQSHFGIIPAKVYERIERQEKRGGPGYSGITVRMIDGEFVVTHVADNSPAAKAGVESGWVIRSAKTGDEILTPEELIEDATEAAGHSVLRVDTALSLAGQALVSGKIGEQLQLQLADANNDELSAEMELIAAPGKPAKLGNLPTTYVNFESKPLANNIGFMHFNAFLDAPRLIQEFQNTVSSETSKNGLIIDLRGNMGGLMILPLGMCGWFVTEPVALGDMQIRNTPLSLKLNPRSPRYTAPVAVLVDECTISAAEVMSGGMQDLGLARLFGSKTAGLVLPSAVTKLPSGDGFQYAMANYQSASGRQLEINGVVPDVELPANKAGWAHGEDPVLSAAVEWINGQNSGR